MRAAALCTAYRNARGAAADFHGSFSDRDRCDVGQSGRLSFFFFFFFFLEFFGRLEELVLRYGLCTREIFESKAKSKGLRN